ncbi:MAG TPA: hypothetical protein V6D02_05165 [Candidatus Obscuribacterales bacterium]
MAKFWVRSFSATAAAAAMVAIATAASANEPPVSQSAYPPRAMNEIFNFAGDDYGGNRSVGGQLSTMFGVGGFPENNITKDAYAIYEAYEYMSDLQMRSDATIRVPDLVNPYNTSVQFLPSSSAGMVSGSEFIFE